MAIVAPLTANDVAISQSMDLNLMEDTCVRRAWTQTRDSDNQEGEDWIDAETFVCKFSPARRARPNASDSRESTTNIVITTPVLWLPLAAAAVFTTRDRVRITHRYGVALAVPLDFAIEGSLAVELTSVMVMLSGEQS